MTTHMPRTHPVRELLAAAAAGAGEPTRAQLDDRLIRDDVPDDADLNAHRGEIVTAFRTVAKVAKAGEFKRARDLADDLAFEIGEKLTDAERAVDHTIPESKSESLDDIGARMFTR